MQRFHRNKSVVDYIAREERLRERSAPKGPNDVVPFANASRVSGCH
jgi:hypothetical protein